MNTADLKKVKTVIAKTFPEKEFEVFPEFDLTRVKLKNDYFLYFCGYDLIAIADVQKLQVKIKPLDTCISLETRDAVKWLQHAHKNWGSIEELINCEIPRAWYLTLASNHQDGPGCVEVWAYSEREARVKMFDKRGARWAFLYSSLKEIHPADRSIKDVYC